MTIGNKIDDLFGLREQKKVLEAQLKAVEEEIREAESALIDQLDSQGLEGSKGSRATVSITTSVKPTVEDWDAFYKFIHRNNYYHLLERRPSVTGCRELFEASRTIPGVVPFTKRSLNIRQN